MFGDFVSYNIIKPVQAVKSFALFNIVEGIVQHCKILFYLSRIPIHATDDGKYTDISCNKNSEDHLSDIS